MRWILTTIVAAVAIALAAATAGATTVVVPSDAQLFAASRAVVEGTVREIRSRKVDGGRQIVTYVTVDVATVFSGALEPGPIVLRELGGEVGDEFTIIQGSPEYRVGERVLLFLDADPAGVLRTWGLFLGKYSVRTGDSGLVVARQNATGDIAIAGKAPDGEPVTDVAPYAEFVNALTRRAASSAKQADQAPLVTIPSEYSVPVAAGDESFHTDFTLLAGRPRWFEADEGLAIPYYIRPTPFLIDGGRGAVADSLAAWSVVPGCSLRLFLADDTENCGYSRDGQSTVSFDDCKNQISGGGCFGVIAIGGSSGRSSEKKIINGVEFVRITDADVVLNSGMNTCLLGHRLTIREIITHELGHSVGLGHSSQAGPEPNPRLAEATMYYQLHEDGRGASLKPDDVDAITFVYPISEVPPSVVTESLPGGNVGVAYDVTLEASGGATPLVWSLASGQLPAGLSLGADGRISGTPTAKVSTAIAIAVTDARGRTATRDSAIEIQGPRPVIDLIDYRSAKKRLTVSSRSALAGLSVEIRVNGTTIAPPVRIKSKPDNATGGTRLMVKGTASELNVTLPAGSNSLVLVVDGVASDPVAF
jgi:hypothetical protein